MRFSSRRRSSLASSTTILGRSCFSSSCLISSFFFSSWLATCASSCLASATFAIAASRFALSTSSVTGGTNGAPAGGTGSPTAWPPSTIGRFSAVRAAALPPRSQRAIDRRRTKPTKINSPLNTLPKCLYMGKPSHCVEPPCRSAQHHEILPAQNAGFHPVRGELERVLVIRFRDAHEGPPRAEMSLPLRIGRLSGRGNCGGLWTHLGTRVCRTSSSMPAESIQAGSWQGGSQTGCRGET